MQSAAKSETQSYELVIIGLGIVGSSTLYEAAQMLNKNVGSSSPTLFSKKPLVLGIEQYAIAHKNGSSHGESRITRLAIGEGPDYVSLTKKSQNKLKEIQTKTNGEFGTLCYEGNTGVLVIGSTHADSSFHGTQGFLQKTRSIAVQHQIPHVNFDPEDNPGDEFSQFIFRNHEGIYREKTMGIIDPEAIIKSQIQLAKQANAEVKTNEKVLSFEKMASGKIKVKTSNGEYLTNKLVITAGPWISDFLEPQFKEKLNVYRQTVFYFEVEESWQDNYRLGNFPPFIWDLGNDTCVYGFPIMQNGKTALKIGTESYLQTTTPSQVDRKVSDEEIQNIYENFIKPNFRGILPTCKEAFVCLYTKTPDSQFLIDYPHGFDNNVLFASTCSGHGAKHAPALGEALAQQIILGYSDENILKFNLNEMNKRNNISATVNVDEAQSLRMSR